MLGFSFWYHMLEELHFQWQMGHLFSETPQGGVHNISAGNHLEMKCLKFYFISMKRTQQSNASASVHFDPLCTSLRNVERTNEQAILFVFPCLGITNFVILFRKTKIWKLVAALLHSSFCSLLLHQIWCYIHLCFADSCQPCP